MPTVTWDHVHLRTPDPESTAAWLQDVLGGVIVRGPGRIDVNLGGANVKGGRKKGGGVLAGFKNGLAEIGACSEGALTALLPTATPTTSRPNCTRRASRPTPTA